MIRGLCAMVQGFSGFVGLKVVNRGVEWIARIPHSQVSIYQKELRRFTVCMQGFGMFVELKILNRGVKWIARMRFHFNFSGDTFHMSLQLVRGIPVIVCHTRCRTKTIQSPWILMRKD
jgi:hypothetical protein